jgi:hydrogenase nickel incorporation protein HypA/HybF
MHELSIALSIVEIVDEEAKRHGSAHVQSVRLRIGQLAGVARDALTFSYGLACEGTRAEGSTLVFEDGQGMDLVVVSLEVDH